MTIFRFEGEIVNRHGPIVSLARGVIRLWSFASNRGKIFGKLTNTHAKVELFVFIFLCLSIIFSLLINFYKNVEHVFFAISVISIWRMYDILTNHLNILIVDHSNINHSYKSSVRSLLLGILNLVEIMCFSFVVVNYLIIGKIIPCAFAENQSVRQIFIQNMYNILSFNSISPQCAGDSGAALIFSIFHWILLVVIVLVLFSRAIGAIPFVDSSANLDPADMDTQE